MSLFILPLESYMYYFVYGKRNYCSDYCSGFTNNRNNYHVINLL